MKFDFISLQLLAVDDYIAIIQIFIPSMWDAFWLYLLCYSGDNLTNRFASLAGEVYQFDWYSLPVDIQRCLLMMLIATQQNVYLRGSGGAKCTRDSYKKVQTND